MKLNVFCPNCKEEISCDLTANQIALFRDISHVSNRAWLLGDDGQGKCSATKDS